MEAIEAVEKILALRELSAATGTRVTRAVNDILQSLRSAVLAEVAVDLRHRQALRTPKKVAQDAK